MFDFWQGLLTALERLVMLPSLIQAVFPSLPFRRRVRDAVRTYDRTTDDLLREVQRLFEAPLSASSLLAMSGKLQAQFTPKLQDSDICMLPSYNHKLPSGLEQGTYLALDVGGSTFRVAVVELAGKQEAETTSNGSMNGAANGSLNGGINGQPKAKSTRKARSKSMRIVTMKSYPIDNTVRALRGHAFFDWMADRIASAVAEVGVGQPNGQPLPMGLSWSFPVEQTSIHSGNLLAMGKGFLATEGTLGSDLSELIMAPCRARNLNVHMDAIVNDSSATLLSRAYEDPSTRFAVILGTGFNIAVHLPVRALASSKYGSRPQRWLDEAEHVLVNTELSMFGKNVFPTTRWDDQLNDNHVRPDFQPFEHMISGRYLGEVVRLIVVEAIRTTGLFSGETPEKLSEPYSLDTGTIAAIETDETPTLSQASSLFQTRHPLPKPASTSDMAFVRQIAQLVSHRAAAYLAAGIHALWLLRTESEGLKPSEADRLAIGCNGSVIEKYPSFRQLCQSHLDELTTLSGAAPNSITLEVAVESAIFGAAVAVCCLED